MANEVYADGMEIACKAAAGKSICAFPDVCFTPPQTPATPPGVPIPYPNTGMASDTTDGSKSVKISNKEVMLKNKSYFKKSYGDEAGCAPKKGVITSNNMGKVFFNMWSMDVKVEGENVVRHLDLTTHNHGSMPGQTVPWTYLDRMKMAEGLGVCEGAMDKIKSECSKDLSTQARCPDTKDLKEAEKDRKVAKDKAEKNDEDYEKNLDYINANEKVNEEYKKFAEAVQKDDCQKALRCFLSPYKPSRCCPKQTPHHVIDAASFLEPAEGIKREDPARPKKTGWKKYNVKDAPCVCVEGPNQSTATHGEIHARTSVKAEKLMDEKGQWTRKQATITGVESINKTFPETEECKDCLHAQLDRYHNKAKTSNDDKPIDATTEGSDELKEKFRREKTISRLSRGKK